MLFRAGAFMGDSMTRRVWMYVDGYNFYYAVKRASRNLVPIGFGWCDFRRLAELSVLTTMGPVFLRSFPPAGPSLA
jgi:hypothetical protein